MHLVGHINKYSTGMCRMSFHLSGGTVTVVKHKRWHCVQECQHISAISLTTKTKNRKQIGFLRTALHTDFSSLLSRCCIVPHWLPCRVFYGSGNKMSQHTFLILLSDISVCSVKCKKCPKNCYALAVWQYQELYSLTYHLILVCLPPDSVAELTCWLIWYAVKENSRTELISGLW